MKRSEDIGRKKEDDYEIIEKINMLSAEKRHEAYLYIKKLYEKQERKEALTQRAM